MTPGLYGRVLELIAAAMSVFNNLKVLDMTDFCAQIRP